MYDEIEGPSHPDMRLQDPSRPGYVQCFDPSTLQHLGECKAMTAEEVNEVVRRARVAQQKWAKTSFEERKHVLRVLQKYITTHTEDICRVSSRDSGKPSTSSSCCLFGALAIHSTAHSPSLTQLPVCLRWLFSCRSGRDAG